MTILILTNKFDITADFVIFLLKKSNIEYIRINTEDMIQKVSTVTLPNFSYTIENNLQIPNFTNKIHSILLRRPGKPFDMVKNKPHISIIKYVSEQWSSFISALEIIPNIMWINNPRKNSYAEIKINQLYLANRLGLKIPNTCITNNKIELEKFYKNTNGKIIAKALSSPLIKDKDKEYFIFSNRLSSIKHINEEELLISPTIFQEEIENKIDYRLTIIGDSCFTVKIESENTNVLDWRTIDSKIKYQKTDIPSDIQNKAIKLVSSLGLVFGAIDIVKSNDAYYFLEINPNGEWGWLQKNAKLPIAEALVDKLMEKNTWI